MIFLYVLAGAAFLASLFADRRKTWRALKTAAGKFLGMLPAFLTMLCLVALVLTFLPKEVIARVLGGDNLAGTTALAALFGSVTLMPGFIAFPLSGLLLKQGVPYLVLAAFTTTLMMVGVVTFPLERHYMGTKVGLIRNSISLLIALLVSLCVGFFFGELI